jgi:maltose alpha-D-glucosyltransferase/alpha-amylase
MVIMDFEKKNQSNRDWYQHAVFYEIYLRSFKDSNQDGVGDLNGLVEKLDYLAELGIDCIWLLPIYPSPRKDDGYDIADYYAIDPTYGSLDDFKALLDAVHERGMRIIMDLVVNHTSDQHPWFKLARSDPASPYRDYYVWSDSDRGYPDARIIFIDTEKSNWSWDEQAGQFYWHRFYACQPDLNYDNPAVRAEMLRIIRFWLDLGVDGLRVDAVPYLFERQGTNCENLPETHAYFKEVRRLVDREYPGRVLLCEANQLPADVVRYLGSDDEFHMAFHFPLMPKIFMALRMQDRSPILDVLRDTPVIPAGCQWGTFLRNHDELTLEMVTPAEREWMWREYAPDPHMRLNLGIRRRLAPLLGNDQAKLHLAYSILFSLPGSQFIYYGDEIGMGEDLSLPDRDCVRTPMQWDASGQAGFSSAGRINLPVIQDPEYAPSQVNVQYSRQAEDSLWQFVRTLIRFRKREPALRGNRIRILDHPESKLLAYSRGHGKERQIILHNLGEKLLSTQIGQLGGSNHIYIDLLSGRPLHGSGRELRIQLEPHESQWLKPASKIDIPGC